MKKQYNGNVYISILDFYGGKYMINKGTKRLLSLVAMMIIMISTTLITVSGDTVRDYKIQEIGLKISLPAYMNVITRETSTNDEVYKKYGTSGKDLTDLDMYLVAYSADATQTLTVTVTEDKNSKKVKNYNTLSESQLNTIKDSYQKNDGCESCSIENYNNLVYFTSMIQSKINNSTDAEVTYSMQGDTLVDGKYYHFNLVSADGAVSDDDKDLLTSVLESATYDSEKGFWDANIITFVCIVGGVLVLLIIFIIIISHRRKKKLRKRLREIDEEIHNNDRKRNRERDRARKNRHTATGANRPDAFFDGVDGYETSENMDKIERDLIREAHRNVENLTEEPKNTSTDKVDYSDFFEEYENTKNNRTSQRPPRSDNSRRNKKNKRSKDSSRRKF